jgi:hypothetical protein
VWVRTPDAPVPPAPTVVEVRSTSVALRWPVLLLASTRQPAAAYVVEMASSDTSDVRDGALRGVASRSCSFSACGLVACGTCS